MLDENTILQPKNIGNQPIGGITVVQVLSMDHHILTIQQWRVDIRTGSMLAVSLRTRRALAPIRRLLTVNRGRLGIGPSVYARADRNFQHGTIASQRQ
jgi:hypothetical protein